MAMAMARQRQQLVVVGLEAVSRIGERQVGWREIVESWTLGLEEWLRN